MVKAFDGSLTGGGATLQIDASRQAPEHYLATRWTATDAAAIGATHEDPAFQPHWEAFMLLVAVHTWSDLLAGAYGRLMVCGDAKGVLQAVVYRRARNPLLNLIVAEIQLELGATTHDLVAAHFWSEDNQSCDALSRLHEGAAFPAVLIGATRWTTSRRAPWVFVRAAAKGGVMSR